MSLWRLVTRLTLTPGPSSSSYRVTVGPTTMPTRRVSTPWSASAFSSVRPVSSIILRSTCWEPVRSSRVIGGSFQADPRAGAPDVGVVEAGSADRIGGLEGVGGSVGEDVLDRVVLLGLAGPPFGDGAV